ncbi:MAG TPA: hypothetical protein VGQ77_14840 [Methylomirabilota bacterium]|jgi:hypothetical protein|nr:hypothetical protein [Methylomirabilota bacterium]
MPELLLIVARDEPMLYERLRLEFEGDEELSVVLDRRVGDRRRQPQPVSRDERRDERRADRRQALVDDQLQRFGWATVRAR